MSAERGSVRVLILAGGSGTRLWPRSTDSHPKPFLPLASSRPLLLETFERARQLAAHRGVYVSGRKSHEAMIRTQVPDLPKGRLILEPVRRNTAPAIALAALAAADEDPESILVVLPSDPAVRDEAGFLRALRSAIAEARQAPVFVTLGVTPTRPETGFGYLETDPKESGAAVRTVTRFVEKPPLSDAEAYAASGLHFWNSGIFVFRVSLLFSEMERLCPDVLASARLAHDSWKAGDDASFDAAFTAARSISIDYAVMERAARVVTVPCDCGWSDLGSWEAVFEFHGGAEDRSVHDGPVVEEGGTANLILASPGRTIRVLDLSNLVVVDSPEGILVMPRGSSDTLRRSVEASLAEKPKG